MTSSSPDRGAVRRAAPHRRATGSTIGVRVWMRIAAQLRDRLADCAAAAASRALPSDSGSPPLRITSSTEASPAHVHQGLSSQRRCAVAGLVGSVVVVPAEAVAAMHGAGAGGDQQRPPLVLVQQAGRAPRPAPRASGSVDEARHRQQLRRRPAAPGAAAGPADRRDACGATKPRGTRSGKPRQRRLQRLGSLAPARAARGPGQAAPAAPADRASASRQLPLPGGVVRRVAAGGFSRYHSPPRYASRRAFNQRAPWPATAPANSSPA